MHLTVFVPTPAQWDAGARWYTCQFTETSQVVSGEVRQRTESLRGAMTGAAPVAHRCTNVLGLTEKKWAEMIIMDCAQPHDAEYAGSFKVPGTTRPTAADQREAVFDQCWIVVARYLGATEGRIRVGYIPWGMNERDWQHGDRYVRCFVWSHAKKTIGSMKGIGNRAPA